MSDVAGKRVAILGGGAAAMAAAWRLSEPGWQRDLDSITVYQRGWRLGGKGASSRGVNGRIEEHGLHVWLGYYENAFRLMRECYGELDREQTDPGSPIKTWREAFEPASSVGLEERHGDAWKHWVADFGENDQLPGEPDADAAPMSVAEFAIRALRLVGNFYQSIDPGTAAGGTVLLSASPEPPSPSSPSATVRRVARQATASALAAAAQLVGVAHAEQQLYARDSSAVARLGPILERIHQDLRSLVLADDERRRLWFLADLLVTTVRGIVADGLLTDPRGFSAINDEEYRDWISRHGVDPATLESPLVRGVYDLVFGYQDGDPSRPRFAAGLGLFLSAKIFFDYRGAIFWKMQAGMGDVVFAPLYEALRQRGVRFEFFHRVDALRLTDDQRSLATIEIGRQLDLNDGRAEYEPLIDVKGLPCFPAMPLADQLALERELPGRELESLWGQHDDVDHLTLQRGVDFDVAVFAIPIGMVPHLCDDLIAASPAWKRMVDHIGTVATQSFQIWLRHDGPGPLWDHQGVTMTGYLEPFDTWSSMEHLIDAEDWPDGERPLTLGYFCNTLHTPDTPPATDHAYPDREQARVHDAAIEFLEQNAPYFWPASIDESTGKFDWDLLAGAGVADGAKRFDSQFWIANVDPSERYVQSLPGSDKHRLRTDESGFDGLYLAGDWINSGLNAGCIEAAVISGLQAANAVRGDPLSHRIAGYYMNPADSPPVTSDAPE